MRAPQSSFSNSLRPFPSPNINTKGWYSRQIWGSSSWLKIRRLILTSKRIFKTFKGISLAQQEHYSAASMTQPKLKGIRPSNSSSRPDLTIYRSTRKLLSPDLVTTTILTNLRCHSVIYKSRPDLSQIDTKQLRQDQVLIDTRTALVFTVSKSHHHRAYSLSPSPTSKCLA